MLGWNYSGTVLSMCNNCGNNYDLSDWKKMIQSISEINVKMNEKMLLCIVALLCSGIPPSAM